MELERYRLAGTTFLGSIVVTDGSKFEKKKCTQEKTGNEGAHQKREEGKKWPSWVFIEAWNTSRFAVADQKVWALCCFPPPLRFITLLKIIKVRMPKNKFFFVKQ